MDPTSQAEEIMRNGPGAIKSELIRLLQAQANAKRMLIARAEQVEGLIVKVEALEAERKGLGR
jgi:hypothetical protein